MPGDETHEDYDERLRRLRAAAIRVDTQPRLLSFASWLRRRLPGDERYGDPLSTSGHAPVDVVARGVSVLTPPRPSVAGELGLGALQLWQSLSEAQGRGRGHEEVALMFTDLVGFSSWALEAGDEATLELLRDVGLVVERSVTDQHGEIVKRLGDGIMAAFDTPQFAVSAALDAQDGLADVEVAGYRPRMRAGVHYGRPRRLGGDFLGVDVNIAARVGEAAGAGQVLVSEPAIALLDASQLKLGRAKTLRAQGAPKGLRIRAVTRQ
jgi:adenylate cyclase